MAQRIPLPVFVLTVVLIQRISAGTSLFGFDDKKDSPRNYNGQGPIEKAKVFRCYVSGFDYEDRPVVIQDWGHWDMVWLVEHPELSERFMRNYEHYIDEILSGNFTSKLNQFLPNGIHSDEQIVVIKNFDGFDIRQIYTPAATKFALDLLSKMRRCFHSVAYGLMVNSNPASYQLIEMAKPLAGEFLEKVEVYGTNTKKWIPRIKRKIPLDQLPHSFGGPKDFKPLLEYSFI